MQVEQEGSQVVGAVTVGNDDGHFVTGRALGRRAPTTAAQHGREAGLHLSQGRYLHKQKNGVPFVLKSKEDLRACFQCIFEAFLLFLAQTWPEYSIIPFINCLKLRPKLG